MESYLYYSHILGLFHKLEEEVKVNTYMVNEKIPKELQVRKKYVQDVEKVVSEPAMGQSDIDSLNDQVSIGLRG